VLTLSQWAYDVKRNTLDEEGVIGALVCQQLMRTGTQKVFVDGAHHWIIHNVCELKHTLQFLDALIYPIRGMILGFDEYGDIYLLFVATWPDTKIFISVPCFISECSQFAEAMKKSGLGDACVTDPDILVVLTAQVSVVVGARHGISPRVYVWCFVDVLKDCVL
jgi:hypothetical protein